MLFSRLRFRSLFLLTLLLAGAVSAGFGRPRPGRGRNVAAVAVVETRVQRLARLQVSITNALGLQPHQVCVLHQALLAQTAATLPTEANTVAPNLTMALADILRPEQRNLLAELAARPTLAAEFEALSVRP